MGRGRQILFPSYRLPNSHLSETRIQGTMLQNQGGGKTVTVKRAHDPTGEQDKVSMKLCDKIIY